MWDFPEFSQLETAIGAGFSQLLQLTSLAKPVHWGTENMEILMAIFMQLHGYWIIYSNFGKFLAIWRGSWETASGWWFGTFFIFPYIGNNHPNWLIFFRGVAQPPTSSQLDLIWVWKSGPQNPSTGHREWEEKNHSLDLKVPYFQTNPYCEQNTLWWHFGIYMILDDKSNLDVQHLPYYPIMSSWCQIQQVFNLGCAQPTALEQEKGVSLRADVSRSKLWLVGLVTPRGQLWHDLLIIIIICSIIISSNIMSIISIIGMIGISHHAPMMIDESPIRTATIIIIRIIGAIMVMAHWWQCAAFINGSIGINLDAQPIWTITHCAMDDHTTYTMCIHT